MRMIAALLGLTLAAGCVPDDGPLYDADPALQMTAATCVDRGRAAILGRLRDPFSAVVEMADCENFRGVQRVRARVNAKNAFGGFTGFQDWIVVFQDGQPVAVTRT